MKSKLDEALQELVKNKIDKYVTVLVQINRNETNIQEIQEYLSELSKFKPNYIKVARVFGVEIQVSALEEIAKKDFVHNILINRNFKLSI